MKRKLTVFLLVLILVSVLSTPAYASSQLPYVTDAAGLLSQEEAASLERFAADVSAKHGCGVYVITLDDYTKYSSGGDVFETTYGIYHANSMGIGEDRNGIIVLLSMRERDYAMFVYGDYAEYAFNGYGQAMLEDEFLDDFAANSWYSGFYDYISAADEYLTLAAAGTPVKESPFVNVFIALAGSAVISLVICIIFALQMLSVKKQTRADNYVTDGGLNLSQRQDIFMYNTETRRVIQKSSGSGSSVGRSGGGGSGRSGKF